MRRNRKARRTAQDHPTPENFHEWRKRAKDLRYHLALVGKAWPLVLEGYESAAKELENRLGDDHNLSVLRETILKSPDDFGKEEDLKVLLKIVERQQHKLRAEAKSMATSLYSEKPDHWRRRLELFWKA